MVSWACSFQANASLQFNTTLIWAFGPLRSSMPPQKHNLTDRQGCQELTGHQMVLQQPRLCWVILLSNIPVHNHLGIEDSREEAAEERMLAEGDKGILAWRALPVHA